MIINFELIDRVFSIIAIMVLIPSVIYFFYLGNKLVKSLNEYTAQQRTLNHGKEKQDV